VRTRVAGTTFQEFRRGEEHREREHPEVVSIPRSGAAEHDPAPFRAKDVRELHVAVDEAGAMHRGKRAAEIDPDERRLPRFPDSPLLQHPVESLTAQELAPN